VIAVSIIDRPIRHDGVAEQRVIEDRRFRADIGPGEVSIEQTRLAPRGPGQFGPAEIGPLQTRFSEDDAAGICGRKGGAAPVDTAEDGPRQRLTGKGAAGVVAASASAAGARVGA
jgi:hypothetical protein